MADIVFHVWTPQPHGAQQRPTILNHLCSYTPAGGSSTPRLSIKEDTKGSKKQGTRAAVRGEGPGGLSSIISWLSVDPGTRRSTY